MCILYPLQGMNVCDRAKMSTVQNPVKTLGDPPGLHPMSITMPTSNPDTVYLQLALQQARAAASLGEVPVGAVVARHGEVIATAHNTRETEKNALHHAELLAIDAACKALGGWRLWECELFVTLEPCPMCAGGIINSRLRRVVYGAADTKAGCCGSVTDLFALPFNHHPVVEKGLREAEAQQLLQAFFVSLREKRAGRPRWKPPVPENRGK